MKYLKTFEQNNFEKYAIFSFEKFPGVFMIVEVVNIDENSVNYKKRYTLRDYHTKPRETTTSLKDEIHSDSIDKFKKRTVYQSNNLEDCLEQIQTIMTSKKYNL